MLESTDNNDNHNNCVFYGCISRRHLESINDTTWKFVLESTTHSHVLYGYISRRHLDSIDDAAAVNVAGSCT